MLDLSRLNPPQLEAVRTIEGPLLVLAGAGSGKTRVIVHRIAYMIQQGVAPANILAVTFTNKAAAEMKERVADLVGPKVAKELTVCTFHAFGCEVLRHYIDRLGYPKRFGIADASDQASLVKRAMRDVKIDDRRFDARRVLAGVSRAKCSGVAPIAVNHQSSRKQQSPVTPSGGASSASPGVEGSLDSGRPLASSGRPALGVNGAEPTSRSTAMGVPPTPKPEGLGDEYDLITSVVFPKYELALKAQGLVDFDDLILLPMRLLKEHAEVRDELQDRCRYLLVDEYQDTNRAQLDLLVLLAGERKNVCAVGDDDQSIYSWRGAEVENILCYDRHFPGCKEIRLEQNYRSTSSVLEAANAVIAKNEARKPKRLFTSAGPGEPLQLVICADEDEEGRWIAREIARLIADGRKPRDMAILYRTNGQSRPLEESLRAEDVPYDVVGGQEYFDRKEIKDIVAYLKACQNRFDEVSLLRIVNVPARGIGDTTLERLGARARALKLPIEEAIRRSSEFEDLPAGAAARLQEFHGLLERYRRRLKTEALDQVVRDLVAEVGMRETARMSVQSAAAGARKVQAVDGFLDSVKSYAERERSPSLDAYLKRIALSEREEDGGPQASAVTLMTLHAAKGLEWPVVFLCGMEEDLMPHSGMQGEAPNLPEERRLAYVGITRARERLYLTRASARLKRGQRMPRTPSRFLEDIPKDVTELHDQMAPAAGNPKEEGRAFFAGLRAQLRGSCKS
ncbi:MAG: UvrD-helicase domain-containing protein [Deltaproteobacteria bacterium]|nr:UvrD-helicase domain-containing protein [Deltaproteobacteria bacterium]